MTRGAPRIVAVGYQGFGNLGDEAILCGIERLFDDAGVGVLAVITGGRAPVIAFPGSPRIESRRSWPTVRAIAAIARSDGLIFAGGGLLHDHWLAVVPRYLAWTAIARLLRRRVVWLGVGVGPFRRGWLRSLAGLTLRMASLVLVRDEASRRTAIGARGRVDGVMPDPAIFLDPPASASRAGLAVIVRAPIGDDPATSDSLAAALADAIAAATGPDFPPAILTFAGQRDDAFAAEVARRVEAAGGPRLEAERLGPNPLPALDRLARAEAVVTVRLHGLLLALLAGSPCVAVAYDDKIRNVADELGLGPATVALDGIDAEDIAIALRRATEPDLRQSAAARVAAVRKQGPSIAQQVREALLQ